MNNNYPETITNFISFIESTNAQFMLALVNTITSFVTKVRYTPEFIEAKNTILSDPELYAPFIVNRVSQLLSEENDVHFRHKYDAAIAGYILLIYDSSFNDLQSFLETIRNKNIPNFWWVNIAGNYLIRSTTYASTTSISHETLKPNIKFNLINETEENINKSGTVNVSFQIK